MSTRDPKTSATMVEPGGSKRFGVSLPGWKKVVFSLLILVLFFGLVELVLLAAGVRPIAYEEDPYVGFSSQLPLFVEVDGEEGKLATARNKLAFFNRQEFTREKPDNTTRIFCVGGSTTYGRPYDDATSFCGWLRELLPAADPTQNWELINAGGISYASYRVAALMEELSEYQPDLFLIYCGHNEFLERRTYSGIIGLPESVRGVSAVLSKTRTFSSLSRLIRKSSTPEVADAEVLDGEVNAILDQAVGPEDYHRDEELKSQVLAHYRFNMARMVEIARAAGAKVVFVTPASNLSNCTPFKSEHREQLAGSDREQFAKCLARAKTQLNEGRFTEALENLDRALALDDLHAHAHYYKGRALEGLQKHDEAKVSYQRARDEDVCPLRALSSIPGLVAEVASSRAVPLVDFVELLEQHSADGIPGSSLFLDHVHPTIQGHRLLALALLDAMREQGWVQPGEDWNEAKIEEVAREVMKKVDPKKQGVAMRNLSKVYSWAGKMEDAYTAAQKALELFPGDAEGYYQAGNLARQLGRNDEAIEKLSKLVAVPLKPEISYYIKAHLQLSDLLSEKGDFDQSEGVAQKLMQLKPDDPLGRNQLIDLLRRHSQKLLEEDRPTEAARKLELLATLQPGDFEVLLQRGVALVRAGDFPEARTALESLIRTKPDYLPAYDNLSYVLAQLGRLDEAEATCLKALAIDPGHQAAQKNLALIRRKKAQN